METTKQRYGADHYEKIGVKGSTFNDREVAKLAALKRWHPTWFDEDGNLIMEVSNVSADKVV